MLTKCPSCSTTFRITSAQLKTRGGKVRCGRCNFVFNALDTLLEDAAGLIEVVQARQVQDDSIVSEASVPEIDASIQPEENPIENDVIDVGEAHAIAVGVTAQFDQPELSGAPHPEANVNMVGAESTELEQAPESEPAYLTDYLADPILHETHIAPQRWPWIVGSVISVAVLLAQLIYYYRVEIAVLQPDLRPLLQAACKSLQCDVQRPRNIDALGIEASDLRPDPLQPGHLTLTATLRSKAPYAQEWPLLELTITDVADQKLAVKDFSASDYLPKNGKDAKQIAGALADGFPANGQIAVALPLNVGELPAAGYRLYIFYP